MQKRIGILGFGREGQSVLRFLKRSQRYKGFEIEILDQKRDKNYLKKLERFDLIFRSPGIPYNLPALKKARKAGVEFSSATKLFFEEYKGKIIGVTGTKGKGTTSTLIYEILRSAGKKIMLAGNIGTSPLDFLPQQKKYPLAVLELSSFQLQDLEKSPEVAIVLDVFPDHQDAHADLKEYYDAKKNIGRWQKKNDRIFYFMGNKNSQMVAKKSPAKKIGVDALSFHTFKIGDLKIPGPHNFRNAVMASVASRDLGVSNKTIIKVVKKFKGLPHRLQFVRKLGNTSFYNDSASTNPHTTAAALRSFPNKFVTLIAGGKDKQLDYKPLKEALAEKFETDVILFGENKKKIAHAIRWVVGTRIWMAKDLNEAMSMAYPAKIKEQIVLFSPAAASFDMFKNYADRGEQFTKLVKKLTK